MLAARTSFSSSPRSHSLSLSTSTTPDSMMAFNPAAAAFSQAQLLAAQQQPMTPMKPDSDAASDALRYLSNGGLLGAQFPFPGMPANFEAMRSMLPQGLPLPLMYPQLQQDFKPEMFSAGGGPFPGMVFDPSVMGFHPYAGLDGARRKNATRETTAPLKEWLNQHRKNPYPNKGEKVMLAVMTKMTLTQVSTWFANARRRLKKENKWSPPSKGDEDDLADIDTIDRPSSSNSNLSDAKDDVDISIDTNENLKTPLGGDVTPKKKIWSIADTIEVKTESRNNENDEAGSSKKDSPSSDDCSPPMSFQQQMMAMCARLPGFNTQLLAACQQPAAATPVAAKNTAFFPFNPLLMAFNQQQQQQQNTLSGSFSSDAASVSPSSSHSASDSKPHLGSPQNSPSPSSPQ